MNGAAFYLFTVGDWGSALLWILNIYFPMGSFWILLGLAIFVTLQAKIENLQLSVWAMALYGIIVLPQFQASLMATTPELAKYAYLLVVVVIAIAVYTLFAKE